MTELERIAAIVGDVKEAQEILDEACDVWLWREHPWQSPYRLAQLLADYHVQQRNKVGLLRRYRVSA
jgi:hypothetical protein